MDNLRVGDRVRRLSRWATDALSANEYKVDNTRFLGYVQEIHLQGQPANTWWHGDRFARLTSFGAALGQRMEEHKAAYRANDRDTAVAAAGLLTPTLSAKEHTVYEQIRAASRYADGATGKEIAQATGLNLNTVTPRFAPLQRKGCIKDSGQRRDRQIVWVAA
jgi:hypothetical protein